MKAKLFLLLLILPCTWLKAQDTIFVKNGKPIPAIVTEKNNTEIKYKKYGAPEPAAIYSIFVTDVKSIHYSDGIVADYNAEADYPAEERPLTAYEMAGSMLAVKFSTGITADYFILNKDQDLQKLWQLATGNNKAELGGNPLNIPILIKMGLILGKSARNWLGDELQLIITPQDAIYATAYDGTYEIKLRNFYYNITMFYGRAINHKKNLLAMIEPGVDLTFMSGYMKFNNTKYLISGNLGTGFHIATGADWIISRRLMVNGRVGYRMLKVKESHEKEDGSSSGYFYAPGTTDQLKIRWNGPYASLGLFFSVYTKLKGPNNPTTTSR